MDLHSKKKQYSIKLDGKEGEKEGKNMMLPKILMLTKIEQSHSFFLKEK
jgi:hypothetical protein